MLLIRHAPADHGGRLCGRTDVPAILPSEADLAPLRGWLSGCTRVVTSPALRCVQTAGALLPDHARPTDNRLRRHPSPGRRPPADHLYEEY